MTEGTTGLGDFLITSGLRLLCGVYVLMCAICAVWTERIQSQVMARYCERELGREKKDSEALICIEMGDRIR